MIRLDFVSNSSSSSFMVAVAKKDIKSFVNDICKKLQDKKSEFHVDRIVDINKNILNYVYDNIRSICFGGILLDKTIKKYTKKDEHYYSYKRILGDKKIVKHDNIDEIFLKKNGDIISTRYNYLWNLTIPKCSYVYSMLNMFRKEKEVFKFKKEFDGLLEYVKTKEYYNRYNYNMLDFGTTIIDKNTLLNSKYLIDLKYNFTSGGWDLDKLLELVNLDDTVIFKMEIGYEGEGTEYDCLYMENEKFWDKIMFSGPGIIIDKNTYGLKKK